MRVGPDTAPYWEPRFSGVHLSFRDDPTLPALRNSLRNTAARTWMHGRWWTNDPDNLMVRDTQTELTAAEVRSQLTLLGLSGGSLVLSDDLSEVPAERRALAATLLPPLIEGMDVLDLFRAPMPAEIVTPVARAWGNWQLVALFNWESDSEPRSLPGALPAFDPRRDYHIVDFWNRRYQRLGAGEALPTFMLGAHDCALLSVRPVKAGPQLVGTTFHISQGGEVLRWEQEGERVRMELRLDRIAVGEIWLALLESPRTVMLNGQPLSEGAVRGVARGIWAIHFRLEHSGILEVGWA